LRKFFWSLDIKQKLILIITLTSTIALLIAFIAFSANNLLVFQRKQQHKLLVLARVVADNSQAAVAFNDAAAAGELLGALKAEPNIEGAAIYKLDRIFARYRNPGFPEILPAEPPPVRYAKFRFYIYAPIILEDRKIGAVYLKVNTRETAELIQGYLLYGVIIIAICIAAAYIVGQRLQKTISEPIEDLTELTSSVSQTKNFSLRATKKSNDELGQLVERFNEMLAEIQRGQEALINSNEALTRSNRDLEQFAHVASHDLQEPLRMVINYVELLESRWKNGDYAETDKYLEFIVEGASRSRQLINDLLEYSRARYEGKLPGVESETILKNALGNLKFSIAESGAKITNDPMPVITADPVKIAQVFQNLISNAIKFKKQEPLQIHVGAREKDDEWLFSVRDNGIGIDASHIDKIFVIFKRLHSRKNYPGNGIGLAICKKIVEQHGGRIWVESQVGQGCTFYFTIPRI
jgi:signal transduction histidine kinase